MFSLFFLLLVPWPLLASRISTWTSLTSKSWSNGNYVVRMNPARMVVGEELGLECEDLSREWGGRCEMVRPGGTVMTVTRRSVTDQEGEEVVGVEPLTSRACGVLISRTSAADLGRWTCRVEERDGVEVELVLHAVQSSQDLNFRLPGTFLPSHYDILLEPSLQSSEDQFDFDGAVSMKVKAVKDSRMFTFQAGEMRLLGVPEVGQVGRSGELEVGKLILDIRREFVQLELRRGRFRAGREYRISLAYSGRSNNTFGFNRRPCSQAEGRGMAGNCWLWFTQFQPTFARNTFPCLDEPALKATFSVSVTRRKEYMARSNMPLIRTVPEERSDYVVDTFATTPLMSTYLLAVTVLHDYRSVSAGDNFTVWAPGREIEAGRGNFTARIGKEIMRFFSNYFGVGYPLPKNDQVYEFSKHFGGMENWGLVTYMPDYLMFGTGDNKQRKFDVMRFVCHELVHTWFGNLVTMSWWSQVWINEGLTTYFSYVGIEHLDPLISPWARFFRREMDPALLYDWDTDSHLALSSAASDKDSILGKFDANLSYKKGACFVRMMESILTKRTFARGLSTYLTAFSFSSVTEEDLFRHLEAAGREVRELVMTVVTLSNWQDGSWPPADPAITQSFSSAMRTWTQQAGLPVVTFSRSPSNPRTWTARQEWLVRTGTQTTARRWFIPISYATVGNASSWDVTKPFTFLSSHQEEVSFELGETGEPCVVFNVQATAFYRVNYDEASWRRIAAVLRKDKRLIAPLNREQIFSDMSALAVTGHVSQEISRLVLGTLSKYYQN